MQTCLDMRAEQTRKREIRALQKAMEETGLKESVIVTIEEEGEYKVSSGRISVVPAHKYLLSHNRGNVAAQEMKVLAFIRKSVRNYLIATQRLRR